MEEVKRARNPYPSEEMEKGSEGQVTFEMGYLAGEIDRLSNSFDRLENRLSDILHQQGLSSGMVQKETDRVPLAENIHHEATRVWALCDRVDSLIARIEL